MHEGEKMSVEVIKNKLSYEEKVGLLVLLVICSVALGVVIYGIMIEVI